MNLELVPMLTPNKLKSYRRLDVPFNVKLTLKT